jgi:hypothetical protein
VFLRLAEVRIHTTCAGFAMMGVCRHHAQTDPIPPSRLLHCEEPSI